MKHLKKILLLTLSFTPLSLLAQTISSAEGRIMYICADSTISSLGNNRYYQLGDGTNIDRSVPVKVKGLQGVKSVNALASMALKSDGTVWEWAYDSVYNLKKVPIDSVVQIAAHYNSGRARFALRSDGSVWAWGNSAQVDDKKLPVKLNIPKVIDLKASDDNVAAACSDGSVWVWGNGDLTGSRDNFFNYNYIPQKIDSLSDIIKVAVGAERGFALKKDGSVFSWWLQYSFKLNISNVKSIFSAGHICYLIKEDETIWFYGRDSAFLMVLKQVDLPNNVEEFAIPQYSEIMSTSIGIKLKDGTILRWGDNGHGQLGNLTNDPIDVPTAMPKPCLAVDCDTIIKSIDIVKLDTAVYPGSTLKIKASEGQLYWWHQKINYLWDMPKPKVSCLECQETQVTLDSDTAHYFVVIMDLYGCQRKERFRIRKKCDSTFYHNPRIMMNYVTYPGKQVLLTANKIVKYSWLPAIGLTCDTCQFTSATINDSITYIATLTDSFGCKTKEKFILQIRNCDTIVKNIDLVKLDTVITPGSSISLNASDAQLYQWSPITNLSCNTCQTPTVKIIHNSEYSVTLTDDYKCVRTERFKIRNNCDSTTYYHPELVLDTVTFPDNPIQLTTPLKAVYDWQPAIGLSCTSCQQPVATITNNTTYIVLMHDTYDCPSQQKYIIRIRDCDTIVANTPVLMLDTTLHWSTTLTLNADNSFENYLWEPSTGLSCTNCNNPQVTITQPLLYTVTLYDPLRCPYQQIFKINYQLVPLTIPNVFTPNGDGINDFFEILGLVPGCSIKIFDSHENLVFQSGNYNNEWDGRSQDGTILYEGTYWYVFSYALEKKDYKGWVYLKR